MQTAVRIRAKKVQAENGANEGAATGDIEKVQMLFGESVPAGYDNLKPEKLYA